MVKSFKLTAVLVAACIVAAGNFHLLFNSLLVEDKRGSFIATDYSVLKKVPKACGNATFLKEIQAMRKKQTKLFGTSRHPNQTHWPTFFKSRVKLGQLARRQNYLTPRSGCRLARWVVRSPTSENKAVIDCHMRHAQQVLNMTAIQHNRHCLRSTECTETICQPVITSPSKTYSVNNWTMAKRGGTRLESNVCSVD